MKKSGLDKSIIILGLIILILISTVILSIYLFRFDALTDTVNRAEPLKILFTVASGDELEFNELFIYHPETKKGGIYYLPPNIGSRLESLDRVDAISVLYNKQDKTDFLAKMQKLTGEEIPFYIELQVDKIAPLVDLLEGIELFISNPVDLTYRDKNILIPSGSVVLDGDKVTDYILYEDETEEERESSWRKQKFLQGIVKRLGEESARLSDKEGFRFLTSALKTNISTRDLKTFIQEMASFDPEQIIFQRAEGKTTVVEGKKLIFPYFEGDLVKHTVNKLLETLKSNEVIKEDILNISLEVLNGTSKTGLAGNTAKLFEQLGYDVVSVGNADTEEKETTVVLDRKGKLDVAQHIAGIIRCSRIHTELNANLEDTLDITIILGRDFDGRYCKK